MDGVSYLFFYLCGPVPNHPRTGTGCTERSPFSAADWSSGGTWAGSGGSASWRRWLCPLFSGVFQFFLSIKAGCWLRCQIKIAFFFFFPSCSSSLVMFCAHKGRLLSSTLLFTSEVPNAGFSVTFVCCSRRAPTPPALIISHFEAVTHFAVIWLFLRATPSFRRRGTLCLSGALIIFCTNT